MKSLVQATLEDEEQRLGADIVMKALRAPARLIASNAGVEGEVIVQVCTREEVIATKNVQRRCHR